MHILGQLGPCKHAQGETLQCRPQHACPEERFAPYHEQCALSLQGLGSQCRCRVMSISLLRWRMWCRGPQLLLTMTRTVWKDWTTLKTYWYVADSLQLTHQNSALQSI